MTALIWIHLTIEHFSSLVVTTICAILLAHYSKRTKNPFSFFSSSSLFLHLFFKIRKRKRKQKKKDLALCQFNSLFCFSFVWPSLYNQNLHRS
ncbi:hypothetical protein BDF14DRAFT_1095792 [Spinellus fusiger]|nr:hypothetical protein BDF14DRAFT_1095792 [Spinellus fusiger]